MKYPNSSGRIFYDSVPGINAERQLVNILFAASFFLRVKCSTVLIFKYFDTSTFCQQQMVSFGQFLG